MTAVVYRDATIFDGTGAAPSAGMSLVVDGDRIVDVVETGRLVVPDGAEVVDLAGRFVHPGTGRRPPAPRHPAGPRQGGGVAAPDGLRRRHGDPGHGRRPAAGRRPRSCLPGRRDPRPRHPLRRPDGRARLLRRSRVPGRSPRARRRARCPGCRRSPTRPTSSSPPRWPGAPTPVRSRCTPTCPPTWSRRSLTEAHRQGIPVWAHLSVFPALPLDVVAGRRRRGVARVAAALADPGRRGRDVQDEGADRPRERGPGRPPHRRRARGDGRAGHDPRRHREHVGEPRGPRRGRRRSGRAGAGQRRPGRRAHRPCLRRGCADLPGSDNEAPPDAPFPTLHDELYFLPSACGMPAAEVLRAATQVGARSAGAEDRMGTLEAGKLAKLRRPRRGPDRGPAQPLQHLVHGQARHPLRPRRLHRGGPMRRARPDDRERARDPRQPERRAVARGSRPAQPQQRPAHASTTGPWPTPTPPGSPRSTSPSATRWARWSRTSTPSTRSRSGTGTWPSTPPT